MPELQARSTKRGDRYLAIVTEETHRLEHIIGDLLDLARLEGGGGTMRRETVDGDVRCSSAWRRGTSASCANGT